MKSVSFIICAAAVILFLIYGGNNDGLSFINNACTEPLTYRIGSIDSRFNISEKEVKNSLQEAADAWANVVDRPVAEYSDQGEIIVNLVYDDRQKLMDEEISLREKLSLKEQQISKLESVYTGQVENFERKLKVYTAQEEQFKKRLNTFNKWVNEKNKAGGFKEVEVPDYKQKQAAIEQLKEEIDREKKNLNRLNNQLSWRVDLLNEAIDEKNALVEEYNQKYSGRKNTIQGLYKFNGSEKEIIVYHFLDAGELRLVLAHELGHALGVQHVSDPEAVMFDHTQNQSKITLKLAEQDKEAIRVACNVS